MLGSLWASVEIVLGSFLHNLHIPVSGTFLSALGVIVMINGYKLWPEPGLFWRTALVTALMKSISPSAIILGPMVGIFMEGVLLEAAVRLFRRHWLGFIIGGALAVSWSLFQKIFTLLFRYGPDFVLLYEQLYIMASKTLRLDPGGSYDLVKFIFILDLCFGAMVAAFAWRTDSVRTKQVAFIEQDGQSEPPRDFLSASVKQLYSIPLLLANLILVMLGLYLLDDLSWFTGLLMVLIYVSLLVLRYSQSLHRLKRPQLWIQLILVMTFSGLLLGGWTDGDAVLNGLLTGLGMATRALLIIFGFAALSIELRNPMIIKWFRSRGMGVLFESVSVAFEVLPLMLKLLSQDNRRLRHPFKTLLSLLASLEVLRKRHEPPLARVLFLTGDQGAGKTELLTSYIKSSGAQGLNIQGIITVGVWVDGERDHYFVHDVASHDRELLCGRSLPESEIQAGPFKFRPEGLNFGAGVLARAGEKSPDLVIIDEVGHLERFGGGWARDMDELVQRGQFLIWSVRPSLLDEIAAIWPIQYELMAAETLDKEAFSKKVDEFLASR